jgi:hypothetical protein
VGKIAMKKKVMLDITGVKVILNIKKNKNKKQKKLFFFIKTTKTTYYKYIYENISRRMLII